MKNRQAQKPPKQGGFFLKYITQGFEVSDFTNEAFDFKNKVTVFTGEVSDFTHKATYFTNEAFDFKNIVSDFMREVRYFISGLFIYKTKNNT